MLWYFSFLGLQERQEPAHRWNNWRRSCWSHIGESRWCGLAACKALGEITTGNAIRARYVRNNEKLDYHHYYKNIFATLPLPPLPLLLFPLLLPLLHFHLCSWILLQRYSFHAKYGLDVCGEGGEYESLVLDCPLFAKKLSIARWDIVADEEGCDMTVGNLRVSQTHYCYWVTHSKYLWIFTALIVLF